MILRCRFVAFVRNNNDSGGGLDDETGHSFDHLRRYRRHTSKIPGHLHVGSDQAGPKTICPSRRAVNLFRPAIYPGPAAALRVKLRLGPMYVPPPPHNNQGFHFTLNLNLNLDFNPKVEAEVELFRGSGLRLKLTF